MAVRNVQFGMQLSPIRGAACGRLVRDAVLRPGVDTRDGWHLTTFDHGAQGFADTGFEHAAHLGGQVGKGLLRRHGITIGALGREGVESVGRGEDPTTDGDIQPRATVGYPAPFQRSWWSRMKYSTSPRWFRGSGFRDQ